MTSKKHFTNEEAKRIGEALGIDWSKFDVEQYRMGLDVELEHGLVDPHTFELASGGRTVQVWYDLMVENDGTERPAVNGEGINNGDRVVVTGELKGEGGTHYSKGDFWATAIVISWTQYKTSLSLPHTCSRRSLVKRSYQAMSERLTSYNLNLPPVLGALWV
jgi:hypothetical protein